MSLALSICVLFISLMQSVNGAWFLNSTILQIFSSFAGASTRAIHIVPLTNALHKIDLNVKVLNLFSC